MKVPVKVLQIKEGKVATSGATRYGVRVRQADTQEEYWTSYFSETTLPFADGDTIIADIEVKGEYRNIKGVDTENQENVPLYPTTAPKKGIVESIGDQESQTEDRITSMSAWDKAIRIVEVSENTKPEREYTNPSTIHEQAEKLMPHIEKYIYESTMRRKANWNPLFKAGECPEEKVPF